MKKLFRLSLLVWVWVMVSAASAALGAEYLVCDPQDGVTLYRVTGLPGVGPYVAAEECLVGDEISTGTLTAGAPYKITACEPDHFYTGCQVGEYFWAYSILTYELGDEISSGTLTEGQKYKITATEEDHFGEGLLVGDTFYSTGSEACDENNMVQEVLSESYEIPECDVNNRVREGGITLHVDISGLPDGRYVACAYACFSEKECSTGRCLAFSLSSGEALNSGTIVGGTLGIGQFYVVGVNPPRPQLKFAGPALKID